MLSESGPGARAASVRTYSESEYVFSLSAAQRAQAPSLRFSSVTVLAVSESDYCPGL